MATSRTQDDPMSTTKLLSMKSKPAISPLETFVACAHQMLDPATPEPVRRAMEPRLLAQLPALRALGVFELFELRDPAMRTWLADELDGRGADFQPTHPFFLL
jgi:hypothetical protein